MQIRIFDFAGIKSEQDIAVEGVTAFAVPPAKSYRYIIELKSSKMSIWIEDRTSKKQWFKGGIDKTDYVSSTNAIAGASAADYVKCVAAYTIELDPVSVERIDILESKLHDQQEELEKLRGELKDSAAHAFVKLTASKNDGSSIMYWNSFESDEFTSPGMDGKIIVLRGGVYSIGAVVTTQSGHGQKVELLKNDLPIQVAYTGYTQGDGCSTTLYTVEQPEKNDELIMTCMSYLEASSDLSIYRLGN